MGVRGSNRARPCMISSRDLFTTLGCYLWPMQKYDLAQKEQYGGWRKELDGKCHPHILTRCFGETEGGGQTLICHRKRGHNGALNHAGINIGDTGCSTRIACDMRTAIEECDEPVINFVRDIQGSKFLREGVRVEELLWLSIYPLPPL